MKRVRSNEDRINPYPAGQNMFREYAGEGYSDSYLINEGIDLNGKK
ncbi:MAG TPA: hypothetical protein VJ824_09115 [Bacillota bacterium]|nr:hypothetical protein [Bacillota bacterium]